MKPRGLFQPLTFCDSVRLSETEVLENRKSLDYKYRQELDRRKWGENPETRKPE